MLELIMAFAAGAVLTVFIVSKINVDVKSAKASKQATAARHAVSQPRSIQHRVESAGEMRRKPTNSTLGGAPDLQVLQACSDYSYEQISFRPTPKALADRAVIIIAYLAVMRRTEPDVKIPPPNSDEETSDISMFCNAKWQMNAAQRDSETNVLYGTY